MLYTIVAVLVLVLDQAVKYYTVRNIPPQAIGDACKTLIPGVIHMTNTRNYGAAFSIMENARAVLVIVSVLFIVGIIILISMDIIHTRFGRWTAVLVMAGALGNCIDRVLLGYVVDMFEFELFTFAVFNVADMFITVCGILFCIHVIVYREPEEERNAVPRPEKKPGRRRALPEPEPEAEDSLNGSGEAEDESIPRRSGKLFRASRKKAPAVTEEEGEPEDEIPASKPRRGRRSRPLPTDDFRPRDPDDPFAEWDEASPESAPAPRAGHPAQPAAETAEPAAAEAEPPAPRRARRSEAPGARAARRRTAPTVEDEGPDAPTPTPTGRKPAAVPEPAPVAQPDGQPDGAGFDEYSLEDILAEFRDS